MHYFIFFLFQNEEGITKNAMGVASMSLKTIEAYQKSFRKINFKKEEEQFIFYRCFFLHFFRSFSFTIILFYIQRH